MEKNRTAITNFGKINIRVAGVTFENRQNYLWSVARAKQRFITMLRREPDNKYDKNAIKVLVQREDGVTVHIGYVPKNISHWLASIMDDPNAIVRAYDGHITGLKTRRDTLGYACDIVYPIPTTVIK